MEQRSERQTRATRSDVVPDAIVAPGARGKRWRWQGSRDRARSVCPPVDAGTPRQTPVGVL